MMESEPGRKSGKSRRRKSYESDLLPVAEATNLPILVIDELGTVVTASTAFAEMTGLRAGSITGRSAATLFECTEAGKCDKSRAAMCSRRKTCHCLKVLKVSGKKKEASSQLQVACTLSNLSKEQGTFTICTVQDPSNNESIRKSLDNAVRQLKEYQTVIKNKSVAIREMLVALEDEKKSMTDRLQSNVRRGVMPLLSRLKRSATPKQMFLLETLEKMLNNVSAPPPEPADSLSLRLTPREIEICNLISQGMSSKQIADCLCTSAETVRSQRRSLRKKLGISHKRNISLRAALEKL